MNRQQRRYQERMNKKAGKRKQSQVKMRREYLSREDIVSSRGRNPEYLRNTPEFREMWKDQIVNLNLKDIKRIDIHKFVNNEYTPQAYMDDFVCVAGNIEQSIPLYEEVEILDLEPYHTEGLVNGLSDIWNITNTGWFSTREQSLDVRYQPFVIFDKDGEECSLPLDSKFLQLWDDDGNNIYEKEWEDVHQMYMDRVFRKNLDIDQVIYLGSSK